MDGGAWQTTVHGVTKSGTGLSDFTFTFFQSSVTKRTDICTLQQKADWTIQFRNSQVVLVCIKIPIRFSMYFI